jgi:tripartite-type tricarboxylate transporter receptor subunit TctC
MTLIVPFAPGGTPDIVARLIAGVMSNRLGHAVVVENRAGASGNIGTNAIAKAPPDGHTFGLSILGPLVTNQTLMGSLPYDAWKELTPISHVTSQPAALVVPPSSAMRTFEDFVATMRSNGDRINYGSIGSGSTGHLSMALTLQLIGSNAVHVPFNGSPLVVTALLRGDVQVGMIPLGGVGEFVRDRRLRLLAVTTARRSTFFPDAPTFAEQGFPRVVGDGWIGCVAPAGLHPAVVERLAAEVRFALSDPDVRDKLQTQYLEPVGSTPVEFAQLLESERDRWLTIIRENGITGG